jgi:hypothetical protein
MLRQLAVDSCSRSHRMRRVPGLVLAGGTRMQLFARNGVIALLALGAASLLGESTSAQCGVPGLVKGADRYNELVCQASKASRSGDDRKALEFFLAASEQPVLESPNIRLFRQIAKIYARQGRFHEADRYLKYDNLSILWMIGIVRCQVELNSTDESLFQDGKPLISDEAKHMAAVLCGPVFDDFSYFRDRDTESFIPAAKAILEYGALRKEIGLMRGKQLPNRR